MEKIDVKMSDGSKSHAHVREGGLLDLLCPCGMTLPVIPSSMPMGIPLLCPCGRQYEWDGTETLNGVPNEIREKADE